jgi:hypothetical protein
VPQTYSASLHAMRRAVESGLGYAWFCKIDVPNLQGVADGQFRLIDDVKDRQLDGVWWQRCSLAIDYPRLDQSGASDQFSVTVPNVNRIASSYVELLGDPLGRRLTIGVVHESETTIHPSRTLVGIIDNIPMTFKAATFVVGPNTDRLRTPGPLFTRQRFRGMLPTQGLRRF